MDKQIEDIKDRLKQLENKRVSQQDIVPDSIKMRHIGEGVRFVRSGTSANKPTTGETATGSVAMYYDTTDNKLWIYNGSWRSVTLS